MKRKPSRASGFTILETMVAIAILVIAITGPMVFAQQSLRAANLARDQVTAFYLGQDAVELVKHVRDENSLTGFRENWLAGLEPCFASEGQTNGGCQLSSPEWAPGSEDRAVAACPSSGDCPLYEDGLANQEMFGIFAGSGSRHDSRFSRRVRLMRPDGSDPTGATEEVLVEVEVSWQTLGVGTRSVLVREYVYNWIQ